MSHHQNTRLGLAGGDIGVLLDVKSRYSLYDICARQVNEPESPARRATPHASGLSLLPSPPDLVQRQTKRSGLRILFPKRAA